MNPNQIQNEIERLTKLQNLATRKTSILKLMRIQKKEFDASEIEYEVDIEKCSLYDMYTCTLVGSGRCQKCEGLIGRGIEYENDLEL